MVVGEKVVEYNRENKLSRSELEVLIGELVEEKLVKEICKKNALEKVKTVVKHNRDLSNAMVTEKNKLQQSIDFLQQSNMELREVADAREATFQKQLGELQATLLAEVGARKECLEQNGYLSSLYQGLQNDHARAVAVLEDDRTKLKKEIIEATELIKSHDIIAASQMVEMSANNLVYKESLISGKKIVRNLQDQLEAERNDHKNELKTILETVQDALKLKTRNGFSSSIFQQILKKIEAGDYPEAADVTNVVSKLYDEKSDNSEVAPQSSFCTSKSVVSTTDKQVDIKEASLLMGRVEMLEAIVKTLQLKSMVVERKLTMSEETDIPDSKDKRVMKEKIVDLVKDFNQFEEMSSEMACEQEYQQVLDMKTLREDLTRMEKKMEAFEEKVKDDQSRRQSWSACRL